MYFDSDKSMDFVGLPLGLIILVFVAATFLASTMDFVGVPLALTIILVLMAAALAAVVVDIVQGRRHGRRELVRIREAMDRQGLAHQAMVRDGPGLVREVECSVCLDAPAVVKFGPCVHVCACETCTRALSPRRCPLCQSPFDAFSLV